MNREDLAHEDRLAALREVARAHEARLKARKAYEEALMAAHKLGVPNTSIALEIGLTETAIRLYIKRHT